jgi:hypothetical protein
MIPTELINLIISFLDLDIQWQLTKQPQWTKKWV